MKYFTLISFFYFVAFTTNAQENVFAKFDKTLTANLSSNHMGNSFVFNFQKYFKRNSFYGGIKFHLNNANRWNQPNVFYYYKNGNASTFGKSIGLNAGYNFNYHFRNNDFVLGYFFFDVECSHLRLKSSGPGFIIDSTGSAVYDRSVYISPDLIMIDNTIGLGFKFRLTQKWSMNMQTGVGVELNKINKGLHIRNWDWDPIGSDTTPFMRVGIGYSFKEFIFFDNLFR